MKHSQQTAKGKTASRHNGATNYHYCNSTKNLAQSWIASAREEQADDPRSNDLFSRLLPIRTRDLISPPAYAPNYPVPGKNSMLHQWIAAQDALDYSIKQQMFRCRPRHATNA
ncbi:hypothetical protein L6452_32965 [Arctium lappa]|uniref:Uncharacterized protein n=1 Tax=Arctium lappa TaxID=4217 RepID=A0ACB8Z766_ARCLA|nr:hypothetical protein L6452_32965 [Arctium lappa]